MSGKKSDLDLKMSANTDKAVQDMAKVLVKQEQQINKLKEANREAKKAGKSFEETGEKMGGIAQRAAEVGLGVISAQTISSIFNGMLNIAKAEFEDMRRKQAEAAQATMTYAKDFVPVIQGWLGGAQIDNADQAFGQLMKNSPLLSPNQMTVMVEAYSGANPDATLDQGVEAVRRGAKMPYGDQKWMLETVGELQQIMPDDSMDNLFDVMLGMQGKGGKWAKNVPAGMKGVRRLMEDGFDATEALGVMMAGFQTEQGGRAVSTLSSLLNQPIAAPNVRLGESLSEEQKNRLELSQMSKYEKFQWMQENPQQAGDVYKGTWATVAPFVKKSEIDKGYGLITDAANNDEFRSTVADVEKSRLGQMVLFDAAHDAYINKIKINNMKGGAEGLVRGYATDIFNTTPGIGKLEKDIINSTMEIKGLWGGSYVDAVDDKLDDLRYQYGPTRHKKVRDISMGGGTSAGTSSWGPNYHYEREDNPNYNPALIAALENLEKTIDGLKTVMVEAPQNNAQPTIQAGE